MTFESYPFAFSSTVIGADFLAPEQLEARGEPASAITYLPTGEQVASYDRLAQIRAKDPGGLSLADDFPAAQAGPGGALVQALTLDGSVFASDAMPLVDTAAGPSTHPRGTSCFTRAISWLHRDLGAFSLPEAVARCTALPARVLSGFVPAFEAKGHLGVGADADVAVFDLDGMLPATRTMPAQAARGMRHVLVGGVPVVEDGSVVEGAMPGTLVMG